MFLMALGCCWSCWVFKTKQEQVVKSWSYDKYFFKYLRSIFRTEENAADRWADSGRLSMLPCSLSLDNAEQTHLPTTHNPSRIGIKGENAENKQEKHK